MEFSFEVVSSAIIGFLVGLLVSWSSRFTNAPESKIVRDMFEMIKRKSKRASWPPRPNPERDAIILREMIDELTKKERQINGKVKEDKNNS